MPTDSIIIRAPDDFHVHLRDGDMLRSVVRHTSRVFRRALVMPNLTPPILSAEDAMSYRSRITSAATPGFDPLMSIKLVPSTTPGVVARARNAGVVAGKLYPEGVTTNSEDGVSDFRSLSPVYGAMEDVGMVLCLHGEDPRSFCMDREVNFLPHLYWLCSEFPRLRVVLEHVTTRDAVHAILGLSENFAATITAHHLALTLDDVVGGNLSPHHFCKPIAKSPRDLMALRAVSLAGDKYGCKFFFGSDTAPHLRGAKECASGCAGVFSAPCAIEFLASVFTEESSAESLSWFTSVAGATFYGLPLNAGSLTIERADWVVPSEIGGVVPFMSDRSLPWRASGLSDTLV